MALQHLYLLQENITVSSILIFFITFFIFRLILNQSYYNNNRRLPPGPRGWPILGALPMLGAMPHVALAKMAKKYGPIMLLKTGSHNMVVASTPEAARAVLKTLDQNFANRPTHAGATLLAYDSQDMVFANYGPKWKLLRKLSNVHMLGGKAIENFSEVRTEELGHMIHAMYQSSKEREAIVVY